MCGIVAGFNKDQDVNEDVLLQFEDQSNRGTRGFGSLVIKEDGTFDVWRATGQIKAILDVKLNPTKALIFHHRQPSSSDNKISQTHPIKIASGDLKHDYYFVHNGVIYNDDERKKHHEDDLGYKYSTDHEADGWYGKKETKYNDSEVLGYDIARFIEGQTKEIKTAGSAAFIMAQVDKKKQKITKIFYGRNAANPLKLAKSRGFLFLSSEGKGEAIKEDMLYSFSLDDFKISKKKMAIPATRPVDSTKAEEKEEEETKSKGGPIHKNTYEGHGGNFSSYNYDDDTWMTWEEEQDSDKFFNYIEMELDNLKETIREATGVEDLYLVDTEDIVKNIGMNIALAVEHARDLMTKYCMDNALSQPKEEEEKDLVIDKTQSK